MDHAAAQPVKSHVHGLGEFGDIIIAGESHVGGIIVFDGRLPLGPFNFYESSAQGYHVLGSKIAASSDSDTEDMTNLIIWKMVRMGPLYFGLGSSS